METRDRCPVSSLITLHFILWGRVSHLNPQLPDSRYSSEPAYPGVPVPASPTLGLQCAGWMLRSALQSSGLHSKCWAISPAHPLPSLFKRTLLLWIRSCGSGALCSQPQSSQSPDCSVACSSQLRLFRSFSFRTSTDTLFSRFFHPFIPIL